MFCHPERRTLVRSRGTMHWTLTLECRRHDKFLFWIGCGQRFFDSRMIRETGNLQRKRSLRGCPTLSDAHAERRVGYIDVCGFSGNDRYAVWLAATAFAATARCGSFASAANF